MIVAPEDRCMTLVSIPFRFRQRFPCPARAVYDWSTDYQPGDIELFGRTGRRRIERLDERTLLLTDTFLDAAGARVVKQKLVHLYPERLAWTSTHTKGPSLHSQFLYELFTEGEDACRLEFTGRQMVRLDAVDARKVRELSRELQREDGAIWKRLARAMAADRKVAAAARPPRRR